MLCVCVNKGSISYARHTSPWSHVTRSGGLQWLTDCGREGRSRMKARLSASAGPPPAKTSSVKLTAIHEKEVAKHRSDINRLRELANAERLVPKTITDFQLVEFLHSVQYKVDPALRAVTVNYRAKREFPNLFSNRNPFADELQDVWTVVNMFTLPGQTENGYKIVYCGLLRSDPSLFDLLSTMKVFTMAVEATLITEGLLPGYVVILDAKDVSLKHCPLSALPLLRKFIFFIQEGLPINIVTVHVINASSIVEKIFTFLKPFLKKELSDLVIFHKEGDQNFHKYVPLKYLQKDLGGSLQPASYHQKEFKKKVEQLADWYRIEELQRSGRSVT